LLIAVSQPRKPGMGEMGWRCVSLAYAGSNPWLALRVEQPLMPAVGWKLTVDRRGSLLLRCGLMPAILLSN
jgi:hypothetical protein